MKVFIIFVALILSVGCSETESAETVIDPWNLVKNTMMAADQQRATAANIQQLVIQQQDFILQTRNLATVSDVLVKQAVDRGMLPGAAYGIRDGVRIAEQAAGIYGTLKSSQDELIKMLGVMNRIEELSKTVERQAVVAGINPGMVLQQQAREAEAGRGYAAKEYARLTSELGQLQFHQKRMDSIAEHLPSSSGAQQTLQMLALQNGVMSDQLSQMLTIQTSQAASQQKRDMQLSDEQLRHWHIEMRALANRCRMGSRSNKCTEAMKYYEEHMRGRDGYR